MHQSSSNTSASPTISSALRPWCRKSIADVAMEARSRASTIAESLLGEPVSVTAREIRWRPNHSLSLSVAGDHAGRWRDFVTGESGDILDLIARECSISLSEALDWVDGTSNFGSPTQVPATAHDNKKSALEERIRDAERIWEASIPLRGSLAERYLSARLCGLPVPARVLNDNAIRYCPMNAMPVRRRFKGPAGAMVALLCDPCSNVFKGIQRTYLSPSGERFVGRDGRRMPPMLLGRSGVVKLWDDAEVTCALGLGEGVETTIAAQMLFDGPPSWAALSSNSLAKFPVLKSIQSLTIYADCDAPESTGLGAGRKAASELIERWKTRRSGVDFTLHCPKQVGFDFNDVLKTVMSSSTEVRQ